MSLKAINTIYPIDKNNLQQLEIANKYNLIVIQV